jgi:hypothetical protein
VKYRTLLQANQPTFFSCSFYQTVLPVGIKAHRVHRSNKGPGAVFRHTMNFTNNRKKTRVKSYAKTAFEDNPFSIYRARNCGYCSSSHKLLIFLLNRKINTLFLLVKNFTGKRTVRAPTKIRIAGELLT